MSYQLQSKPPHSMTGPRRSHAPAPEEMEKILHDLTNLNLDEQPVLGDRKNVETAIRKAKDAAAKDDSAKDIIDITSSSDHPTKTIPPPFLTPKAYKLTKLTERASDATDNQALSTLVLDFIAVLKSNSSRTLTKEGFGFLDALVKQLADPSVFITPLRYVFSGMYEIGCMAER